MNSQKEEMRCEFCFTQNKHFRTLTQDQLDVMSYVKICQSYKKGDIIFREGNRPGGVFCMSSGIVKHYKAGVDGKEQILSFSRKGDLFGFRSVLSDEPACTTTQAIEDVILCLVPSKNFIKMITENADFSMKIMQLSCKELGHANQYILDIAQKNVRERLAEVLLLLHKDFGTDNNGVLQIFLTREELAGMVGTATESVIRLLSEFNKEKTIELNRRNIKILNFDRLKKISDII
ncbi:MAG: Crp/Fnr family transcriptional regulator [Bacteroidota bacterium]|nr:Crp/Fnr family transcriptional regulator [Bacteroidota bacterium]